MSHPIGFVWPRSGGGPDGEHRHGSAVVHHATVGKIRYREGYKYVLAEDHEVLTAIRPSVPIATEYVCLGLDGWLWLSHGYAWDGATGAVDTKTIRRGSLIHDALYQLMRLGLLPQSAREPSDRELRRVCLEDGMVALRAWWVYRGVRIGGGPSAALGGDDVREAP